MWGVYPMTRNGTAQMLAGNLPTIALLLFVALALVTQRGGRAGLVRFWALPLFVSGVALISWGSWRFRQPGDVGLIALAAIMAVRMIVARRARTVQVSAAAAR
jgi:hypothetical protein